MIKSTALVGFFFLTAAAFAEDVTVTVIDRDLDMSLEGAVIEIADLKKSYETDADGTAVISLPAETSSAVLKVTFPGYNDQRIVVQKGQKEATVALVITGVMEGKELVVERAAPGRSDAKAGVSQVLDKAEMKTVAESGLVEDIMSSINTLPGMGYTGGFNSRPSIRGGYASEMGTVMDGISVLNPWHWGGAYSIFNPLMVSSAKMSHGIFSARYGNVMSGLLEVTTKTPEGDQVRVNGSYSTIADDILVQVPFSENAGVLVGGKITYLETLQMLYDGLGVTNMAETIPTMPFIRDGYIKAYYNPSPELHMMFNTFIGSDGIGVAGNETEDGVTTDSSFSWLGVSFFTGFTAQWLITGSNQLKLIASYNQYYEDLSYDTDSTGTLAYTADFIAAHDGDDGLIDGKINGKTTYNLKGFDADVTERGRNEQYQLSLEDTVQIHEEHSISFGAEEVLSLSHTNIKQNSWQEITLTGSDTPELNYLHYSVDSDGNRVYQTGAFALWNFGSDSSLFQGEAGVRVDHCYIVVPEDDYSLTMYPVINPRLSVLYTPVRNTGVFDSVTFTAGTGLYSQVSGWAKYIKKDYGLNDFDISPDRLWFHVIGVEVNFLDVWHFTLEGYYKQYLNRLYFVIDDRNAADVAYNAQTDGKGFSTGFDMMLQKKSGDRWDGYITYSFVCSRFLNPYTPDYSNQETSDGDPLDTWYYPSFHRFNTINLIYNWRPHPGMTFTVRAAVATGAPRRNVGPVTSFAAIIPNGDGSSTVVQRYTRSSVYSDVLRTQISCPVDIRFALSNYFRNSKVRWEWYIGIDDIFVNFYSPKTNKAFNQMTGKESDTAQEADFNIGVPMPSIGMKISY